MAWRLHKFVVLILLALVALPLQLRAAELKISLAELAKILTVTLGEAKLRLHNVPGGMINLTPGSSLTIGTTSVPISVPARTFSVDGVTYAYYVNNLNSGPVTISAVPSAIRFTVPFVTSGPALVGKCVSGFFCFSDQILPEIQWTKAVVTIDLTPVYVNGNLSLDLKAVGISGTFTPDCNAANGLFTGGACDFVLPKARTAANLLKTDLSKKLVDTVNAPDMQEKIAAGLRPYLKFGPVGSVSFSKVQVDATNLTLTFCLACAGGGS